MFESQQYIPELWESLHRKDDNPHEGFQYENVFLRKQTSNVLWRNPFLNGFLTRLNKSLVFITDSISWARNYRNINVDKYYNNYID